MKLVPRPEDPLDRLVGEVRSELQARADRGGRVRDFADVMIRAQRMDPGVTPATSVREAARYASVVVLPRVARRSEPRPRRTGLGPLIGLAAALLVGVAIGSTVQEARYDATRSSAHAVPLSAEEPVSAGVVSARGTAACPVDSQVTVPAAEERPVPAAEEGPAVAAEGGPVVAAEERPVVAADEPAVADRPVESADDYVRIDRAADAAWRRGDVRGARALFEELTRSQAPARLVEAAYGDLGVLIRQSGDDAGLGRLWRRYLARFPRGTFADDARAELCRSSGDSADCWEQYLRSFPRGAHVDEARGVAQKHGGEAVMDRGPQVTPIQKAREAGEE